MITLANNILASGGTISPLKILDVDGLRNRGFSNPSIIKHNDKTLVSLRSCDYTFFTFISPMYTRQRIIWFPINNDLAKTCYNSRNAICEIDDDFKVSNPKLFLIEKGNEQYNGYEDIRLSSYNGQLYASASFPLHDRIPLRICKLNDSDYSIQSYNDYQINQIEKNWMPVLDREGDYMYIAPERVINVKDGSVTDVKMQKAEDTFRGSSQLVPYVLDGRDGYVCVVHRSMVEPHDAFFEMNYYHKLLFFDKEYNLLNTSDWFKFMGFPIEFTCGLMVEENTVTFPFSIMDSCSFISKFDKCVFDDMLLHRLSSYESNCSINDYTCNITRKMCDYIINDGTDNYAAKIALSSYAASRADSKEEALNYYQMALEWLKSFDCAQQNAYMHQLIFQDLVLEQIKKLKR